MSFLAADTLIAVPGGYTAIAKLKIGEIVLAWTPKGVIEQPVIYSSGVDSDRSLMAVYIITENSKLIVGRDQKMLLSDQRLIRADQLVPDKDQLYKSDGGSEAIKEMIWGRYSGGAYHIAISGEDNLIIAAGVVCGDFKKVIER